MKTAKTTTWEHKRELLKQLHIMIALDYETMRDLAKASMIGLGEDHKDYLMYRDLYMYCDKMDTKQRYSKAVWGKRAAKLKAELFEND